MRVLLIQPDFASPKPNKEAMLPARSLIELAAVLAREGHQAVVLDSLTSDGDIKSALSEILAAESFDAVGISVYTALRKEARQLAALVKEKNPAIPVIAGGPHPSRLAKSMVESWPELDYACMGAAEISLPAVLDHLAGSSERLDRVEGVVFRTEGTARQIGKPPYNVDLSALPPPRYDDYLARLPGQTVSRAYVMTARGCPHWCNFCSNLWKKVLPAEPTMVADEVEHLFRDAGVRKVIFYDDCFGNNLSHALACLEEIIGRGVEIELQAVTTFDSIRPEWLSAFGRAGGRDILVGLETGAPKLRRRMNKHIADGQICRGVEEVRKAGLRLGVSIMFGFPPEEDGDVRETLRLLRKIDPDQVMSTVFNVNPGDLLFEFGMNLGGLTAAAWQNEDRRVLSVLEDDELMIAAARAELFDRMFTREVLFPEHRPAGMVHGIDRGSLERRLQDEEKKWNV